MTEPRRPLDFDVPPADDAHSRRPAAERLAHADGSDASPRPPRTPRIPRGGRFGWLFALVAVVVLGYISLSILRTNGTGSRGVAPGERLPPFAAPLALGRLEGDANVATRAGEGGLGRRPACAVRGPQILNVCQLAQRGPVVLAFLATGGGQCRRELDLLERVRNAPAARGVQVAAVAIRGDRGALRREIRTRGWRFPVGYDRDGLVASLYGVSVCPTITFAYPGGVARRTTLGFLDGPALAGQVEALAAASRARGWRPIG